MLLRRHILLGLALTALAGGANALQASATAEALSPVDQALVVQAAHYLEGLTTAEGRFVQTDAAGHEASGAFWIQRPGRARFDYDPPSGLAMASDGRLVTVVNRRLKTVQNYPLGMTPLSIFLARDIRFDRKVVIRQVAASDSGFAITAANRHGDSRGQIVLEFSREPLALKGWSLTDSRGQTVRVRLTNLERSAPKPKAFFDLGDPGLQGARTGEAVPQD